MAGFLDTWHRLVRSLFTGTSSLQPETYADYRLQGLPLLKAVAIAGLALAVVAELFYGSLAYVLLLSPFIPFYVYREKKRQMEKELWELNLQFGEAIQAISTALETGYSAENAIEEAYKDLGMTYGPEAPMMKELGTMRVRLRNNVPIEDLFQSLAERSGLADIESFAGIFVTAKRSGGNTIAIIRSSVRVIRMRVELKRDLRKATAEKQYEMKIMKAMPFLIVGYLRLFSPGMIEAIYEDLFGRVFMTGLLLVYLVTCLVTDRMMRVEL